MCGTRPLRFQRLAEATGGRTLPGAAGDTNKEGLAENSRFAASPSDFNFQLGSLVDVLTRRLGTRFQEHCIPLLGSVSFLGIRFRISARASKAISQDLSMNSSPRGVELISFLISD
jgi:hypothetical protein